jgi:hypothetical protein
VVVTWFVTHGGTLIPVAVTAVLGLYLRLRFKERIEARRQKTAIILGELGIPAALGGNGSIVVLPPHSSLGPQYMAGESGTDPPTAVLPAQPGALPLPVPGTPSPAAAAVLSSAGGSGSPAPGGASSPDGNGVPRLLKLPDLTPPPESSVSDA